MNKFHLIDYKGKYTIIVDELDDLDIEAGTITKKQAIAQAKERIEACEYYGIPPYIGSEPDLKKLYTLQSSNR